MKGWSTFDAARAIDAARAEMVRRLNAVGAVVSSRVKVLLSVPGTGIARSGKRSYGSNPSRPGESPHKQYGHLRRSITWAVDATALVVRIGTNLLYGRYLELGTRRLSARPFLRRGLAETQAPVRAILEAPLGTFHNPIDVG